MSHGHIVNRRRTYGRREHELHERIARGHPRDLAELDEMTDAGGAGSPQGPTSTSGTASTDQTGPTATAPAALDGQGRELRWSVQPRSAFASSNAPIRTRSIG